VTEFVSLKKALTRIQPGDTIVFGGFQTNRAPVAFVQALARKRTPLRLSVLSFPNPLPLTLLHAAGQVASLQSSFNGVVLENGFTVPRRIRQAIETGQIAWQESDVYAMIQGLRAGAQGLPFMPAPGLAESAYAEKSRYQSVKSPYDGGSILVVPPLRPDVAVLHVQQADRQGNVWIADPLNDQLLAQAARRVIVSCEEIVERISQPTIAAVYLDCIVHLPQGAVPTSCAGHYAQDDARLHALLTS